MKSALFPEAQILLSKFVWRYRMRPFFMVLLLSVLVGCIPPIRVESAPAPSPERLEADRAMQTRLIQAPLDSVFPRVLDLLLDHGYQVRSVNRELGQVSFFQQWEDTSQFVRPSLMQEGTLLFRTDGSATRVRAMLSSRWESVMASRGSVSTVSGVQQQSEPEQYRRLLDLLENGLKTRP